MLAHLHVGVRPEGLDQTSDPIMHLERTMSKSRRPTGGPLATFGGLAVAALLLSAGAWSPAVAGCNATAAPNVDWSGCQKVAKYLQDMDLTGANFERANLSRTNLKAAKLLRAQFHKANITRTILREADLSGADLSGTLGMRVYMDRARLIKANLNKAEFYRADLTAADLSNSELSGAQLGRSVLVGANLDGATATYVNLARADLREASLAGTMLRHAYLFRTRLEGVDLSTVKGLTQEQILISCGDDKTKLPQGLTRPDNWPCD
jgi:uncharacterized protein YjbI with pentapeptide repeats